MAEQSLWIITQRNGRTVVGAQLSFDDLDEALAFQDRLIEAVGAAVQQTQRLSEFIPIGA